MKIAWRIAKHGSNPPAGHSSNLFFLSKKGVHMKQTDIAEGVTTGIEQILYERWRHKRLYRVLECTANIFYG